MPPTGHWYPRPGCFVCGLGILRRESFLVFVPLLPSSELCMGKWMGRGTCLIGICLGFAHAPLKLYPERAVVSIPGRI